MPAKSELSTYQSEVWRFRLGGVIFYHTTLNAVSLALLDILLPRSGRSRSAVLILLCTLLLLSIQAVPATVSSLKQIVTEPQPVFLEKYLPRNVPSQLGIVVRGLGRILGRATKLKHLGPFLLLTTVYSSAGGAFLNILLWRHGHQATTGLYAFGTVLGTSYALWLSGRGEDVIHFPTLQRHRILRIKQCFLPAIKAAILIPLIAISIYILLGTIGFVSLRLFWSVPLVRLLPAAWHCTFCFSLGKDISHIVFTERLSFYGLGTLEKSGHNALLFQALECAEDSVVNMLAHLELAHIAATHGKDAERRKAIFGDESGASWQLPAQCCLQQIETVVHAAAEALPQSALKNAAASTARAPKWNQRPTGTKHALVVPDRKQDVAAWLIRSRYQKTTYSVCALADFAKASLEEDRYGVLQLTEPSLGTALQAILSLRLVMQRHLRSTAATGSRRYAKHTDTGTLL